MSWRSIAEWLGFQIVWLTCALGAANGRSAPGIIAAVVFALFVSVANRRNTLDALCIAATGLVGFVVESTLIILGVVTFSAAWPLASLAPAWIVALWIAFGATLASIAHLLKSRSPLFAVALGAGCGPLAYFAGERLGALQIAEPKTLSFLILSLVWGAALPALTKLVGGRS